MQQGAVMLRQQTRPASRPGDVPWPVRFAGKLVLEVLPAALASVIGAFLFAHYQFARPADPPPAAAEAAPASARMLQLVREEHAMLRNLLVAQAVAEKSHDAAADAAEARAAADARLAASAMHRVAAMAPAKADVPRGKPLAVAAAASVNSAVSVAAPASASGAALPPILVAGTAHDARSAPAPTRVSLVERTLAVKNDVVAATLHVVMAIGGIPSWIGHRFGADNLDSGPSPSAAS